MIPLRKLYKIVPLGVFSLVLLLSNGHLFQGTAPSALIYKPDMVASGQWWRVFTHLLAHVSWYHLLLDATAVAILWHELNFKSLLAKVGSAALCALGSLLCATVYSPYVHEVGYCGLSGMAHGLLFLLGLRWMSQPLTESTTKGGVNRIRLLVGATLAIVSCGKSIFEVATGSMLFESIHQADLGIPIVHAHLGGVVGGLIAFTLLHLSTKRKINTFAPQKT